MDFHCSFFRKPQCKDWVYIGETGKRFSDRLTQHRGYIKRKDMTQPAGAHFNMKGHSIEDLRAVAFERVRPFDKTLRLQRESMWISRYDSIAFGANTRE